VFSKSGLAQLKIQIDHWGMYLHCSVQDIALENQALHAQPKDYLLIYQHISE